MKKAVASAVILTAVLCISSNLWAYSGGTGDPNTPYQIANVADFQQLTIDDPNWNMSFILTADIDLTGLTFTQAPIAPDTSTSPGFQGTLFTGIFDGNDHVISNLTINQPTKDCIGLFGSVGSGGQIRNLGVEDPNITGYGFVGGLVGANWSGALTDCYATGTVSGDWDVGGLMGYNGGSLTSCYATGEVSGTAYVGGLVGWNWSYYATITSCYATGSVTGTGDRVGGLVGWNLGGMLITSCYATGSVSGGDHVGGLVGWNEGTLTDCFWDTQTCLPATVGVGYGYDTSTGVTGKTTAEMKTLSTFTDAGWDFASVWAMPLGQYYPVLFLRQMGDLNSDARVDMFDFAIFAANWLEGI